MPEILTKEQRREIAGRARTIHERAEGISNVPGEDPPVDPERIIGEWKDRFPSERSFRQRLGEEGLTEERVRAEIAATRWPATEPLPDWIDTVEELINHVEGRPSTDDRSLTTSGETPFEELLVAILDYARGRLPGLRLPNDAASGMTEALLDQIQSLWIRALYVEFKSFVAQHDPEVADADPATFSDPTTTYYDRFVDAMFEQGFRNLCLEYPVLARQLGGVIEHWTDAVVELCHRLRTDRDALKDRFGVAGEVTAIEPLADDVHARGRLPALVSFETGEIVYKPRPVDGGIAFYTILERLSDHLSVAAFESPAYVPRDDYGWMEFVDYRDLDDGDAAGRYYERAGALLCVAYALDFTDVNLENLIIDGEHPMVVDGETMFHPHFDADAKPVTTVLGHMITHTVLSTALLPLSLGYPREEDDGDFSAFIAGFGHESDRTEVQGISIPAFEAVNTDVMRVQSDTLEVDGTTNTPTVDGEDQPPTAHLDELVRGFSETHEKIRELRDEGRFFSEIADPELVEGIENRLVYRDTLRYVSVLLGAVARDPLRDGALLTVEFERLAVPYFDGRIEAADCWPLYATEREALRRRDVPRFTSRADGRTLFHDGARVEFSPDASGYELSRRRVDAMDDADRRRQASLIRQSYELVEREKPASPGVELTDDRLLAEAVELFDEVLDAETAPGDDEGWVSFIWTNPIRMVPAGPDLYYGRAGIALTAAALHRVSGEQRYRQLTADVLHRIVENHATPETTVGLGGTRGTGSIVYTLSVVSKLLDEPAYRDSALATARMVTEDRLAADDSFDVMEGAAGSLLGLLAYYERFGGSEVLDRAVACGERLLDARVDAGDNRAWATVGETRPSPGFAHGTGGIAYALARLASKVEDPRYDDAVREALAFESPRSSSDRIDWETLHGGADEWEPEWCHGRAGDALVRIGIGEHLGNESALSTARSLLSETGSSEPSSVDNLCCGNLARAEALLVGSRRLDGEFGDPKRFAGLPLGRREHGGTLNLPGHSEQFPNVTLFDGLSGAAYTLLRLRNPEELPSVLMLE